MATSCGALDQTVRWNNDAAMLVSTGGLLVAAGLLRKATVLIMTTARTMMRQSALLALLQRIDRRVIISAGSSNCESASNPVGMIETAENNDIMHTRLVRIVVSPALNHETERKVRRLQQLVASMAFLMDDSCE